MLETEGKGWWLPGGGVDYGETFEQAAKRECVEEAGMEVELKGVLCADYSPHVRGDKAKMRMVYFAEPVSLEAANNPKH